jgi:hypothetical protein
MTIAFLVLLVACFGAGDKVMDLPHTNKARDAIARRDTFARKARADYFAKLVEADSQLVKDLDTSLKLAAGVQAEVEEIARIMAARSAAKDMLKHDTIEAGGFEVFTIKADAGWQETVVLHKGDAVAIQASGSWTSNRQDPSSLCGPDGDRGPIPAKGALIAIIKGQNDSAAVQIGSRFQFTAAADGMLEFGMKGHSEVGTGMNDGSLEVLIKIIPKSVR